MRSIRLLAALSLALVAAVTGGPVRAADPTGQLTVNLVDADGNPDVGQIQVLGPGGTPAGGGTSGNSTLTLDLPPGVYGAFAVTAWGGINCVGANSCSYIDFVSGQITLSGDVQVTAGGHTTATIRAAEPATIVGARRVGDPLSLAYSPGLADLYIAFGGLAIRPSVQWLRNGTPIIGGVGESYVPTGADSGKRLAARLSYEGLAQSYVQQFTGGTPPTVTVPEVSIKKRSSQTFIRMARSTIDARQQAVARIDVTSPGEVVDGKVEVTVGDWVAARVLRNGRAVLRLPRLAPGTYLVSATYLGSGSYAGSKAKPKKLTVTR